MALYYAGAFVCVCVDDVIVIPCGLTALPTLFDIWTGLDWIQLLTHVSFLFVSIYSFQMSSRTESFTEGTGDAYPRRKSRIYTLRLATGQRLTTA